MRRADGPESMVGNFVTNVCDQGPIQVSTGTPRFARCEKASNRSARNCRTSLPWRKPEYSTSR